MSPPRNAATRINAMSPAIPTQSQALCGETCSVQPLIYRNCSLCCRYVSLPPPASAHGLAVHDLGEQLVEARHLRAQLVLVGGYVRARHGSLGAIRRAGFMVRRYL